MELLLLRDIPIPRRAFAAGMAINSIVDSEDDAALEKIIGAMKSSIDKQAPDHFSELYLWNYYALYSLAIGNVAEAERCARQVSETGTQFGFRRFEIGGLWWRQIIAFNSVDRAALDQIRDLLLPQGEELQNIHLFAFHLTSASVLILRRELRGAIEHLDTARRAAARRRQIVMEILVLHNLVATHWMNGDVEQALSCVGEIRKLIGGPNTRVQERQTDLMEAVLRNQRGETSTAQGLLKKALEARVPYLWDVLHTPNGIIAHACALAFETGIAVENARELTRRFRLSAPSHKLSDWPWPIRIRALGRFSIEKGDAPLSYGRKTPRRPFDVIKALIVFGGEEVKIERIADAVWPELDGHAANAAFHTALYRLRKILGNDDVVRLQDGKLTLNRDQCWVDSMALLDECKSIVASALEHAEIERVAARLCRLYQGNFLMLEADVPWTRAARERLRKAFQETMGRLAQRLESLGLVQEAAALQVRRGATDVSATVA